MKLIKLNKYREAQDKNYIYEDILSHSKNPVTNESRATNVHETSHMISSQLRNENRGNVNGFYFENGRGVLIKQPNLTIKDVAPYVPTNLRGYRYNLYFVDQLKYWNDSPLYIMEEWNCYSLGGSCAFVDWSLKLPLERTDAVSGAFEFMIYSTALYMCIKDKNPEYFENNDQFKEFFEYLLDRSHHLYMQGRTIPEYHSPKSDKLYAEYKNSEEGKKFIKFLDETIQFEVNWTIEEVF